MAFKDILVLLDPTPACDDRVKLAIRVAKAFGARLIGADASAEAAFEGVWRNRALEIGRYFEDMCGSADLPCKLVGADFGHAGPGPDFSHCVDLIVAPRPEGEARKLILSAVPDEVILKSGAPMLLIPQGWKPGVVGDHIVIAWNATREATRAVHDAMPLLEKARSVVVFAFSHRPSGLRSSAEALVGHLAQHGVKAIVSDWTNTGELSAIEALFASLDTQDADLVVAGGFGHSRIYEELFGGVSLDLMKQPTLPLLISH